MFFHAVVKRHKVELLNKRCSITHFLRFTLDACKFKQLHSVLARSLAADALFFVNLVPLERQRAQVAFHRANAFDAGSGFFMAYVHGSTSVVMASDEVDSLRLR